MTKQEQAESMANYLGWAIPTPYDFAYDWEPNCKRGSSGRVEIVREDWLIHVDGRYRLKKVFLDEIFSPEGFMALWDKLEEDKICVSLGHEGTFMLIKWNPKRARHPLKTGTGTGSDKYTNFFSAIHDIRSKNEC